MKKIMTKVLSIIGAIIVGLIIAVVFLFDNDIGDTSVYQKITSAYHNIFNRKEIDSIRNAKLTKDADVIVQLIGSTTAYSDKHNTYSEMLDSAGSIVRKYSQDDKKQLGLKLDDFYKYVNDVYTDIIHTVQNNGQVKIDSAWRPITLTEMKKASNDLGYDYFQFKIQAQKMLE